MKPKFDKKLVILCIIFLIIGFAIGRVVKNLPFIEFNNKVSLIEITNFILTIFIAIYLPFILDKKINNKRIEKDILIDECCKIDIELQKLRELLESKYDKKINKDFGNRLILKIRNSSNMLKRLIDNVKPYFNKEEIEVITRELEKNQDTFWSEITVNLRDKKPKINSEVYLRSESNLNIYRGNLSKLKMYINNS